MFLDFFLLLKNQGLPVSLVEYLSLLEALNKRVIQKSVNEFYYLCRISLIKNEKHLDDFDRLFGLYFKGIETISDETLFEIPEDWLSQNGERLFSPEEMEKVKAMGGLQKLLERIQELFREQNERHQGGNKWIGTGGTSPFGAYGYNPEGIRIGQHESRHRRAIKVWDKRDFENLKDDVELETRNIKLALKRLRRITREGTEEELDLQQTIKKTSENAGMLELKMLPKKKNNVKVLLLFDIGGSMDDHIALCSQLFSAAKYEFKNLEFYYFHNCIYEMLWKDNTRRWGEFISTYDVLNKYNSDYKVIFVGDASMSPYEIMMKHGSVEHYNEEAGIVWLNRLKQKFPAMVWLNPVPQKEWRWTRSIQILNEFMEERMFPLTIRGIGEAVEALKD
ncbi:vWA domain-containing protein [Aureispira anguillae]|uniref:VWA domain-containing protein n=1 Tax=Aureispira anguillae TaxID=2864201 RepID=A0A915YBK7_9BACT|nr:VWA domain-containing protein [Aureispira anguillae]BDS10018.1 VWA domain-containing protein [Aureispira anguillae]